MALCGRVTDEIHRRTDEQLGRACDAGTSTKGRDAVRPWRPHLRHPPQSDGAYFATEALHTRRCIWQTGWSWTDIIECRAQWRLTTRQAAKGAPVCQPETYLVKVDAGKVLVRQDDDHDEGMVIIGAGKSGSPGFAACDLSYDGPVTGGDEPHLPYEQPPLSKERRTGDAPAIKTIARRDSG
jgi:hypothetical protein